MTPGTSPGELSRSLPEDAREGTGPGGRASRRFDKTLAAIGVGVLVSGLFLWLAVRNAHPAVVGSALEKSRPGPVALAVLSMAVVYAFQAARWRRIASTPAIRLARFYEMVVSGVACNNVLPIRLGDVLRARWLGMAARYSTGRALGTVVLDRGCDVVALLVFLVLGGTAVASSNYILRIALGGALLILLLAALVLFARRYVARRSRGRRARGLVRRVLRDTAEMLAEPLGTRRPLTWIGLSLAAWATWSVGAVLVGRSLDIHLSFLDAVLVAAIVNLGVALPSSPGYIGTYQWLTVAALGLIGFPVDQALAYSIVLHASWYVPTTLAGGAALCVRAFRRRVLGVPSSRRS